jgi:hypothetical protein
MPNLTSGYFNTASGVGALLSETTGNENVATGHAALVNNTTGTANDATGTQAMNNNIGGNGNVADGFQALAANTAGNYNTADGFEANFHNTTGHDNVSAGHQALFNNTTGSSNIALGPNAGANLTAGSNNVDIANPGVAGESGKIRIGTEATQQAAYLAGVWGTTIAAPTKAVVMNASGRLGTAPAPAAPLKAQSKMLNALTAQVKRQEREIQRLRERVQRGG